MIGEIDCSTLLESVIRTAVGDEAALFKKYRVELRVSPDASNNPGWLGTFYLIVRSAGGSEDCYLSYLLSHRGEDTNNHVERAVRQLVRTAAYAFITEEKNEQRRRGNNLSHHEALPCSWI